MNHSSGNRQTTTSGEGEGPPIAFRKVVLAGLMVVAVTFGGFGVWAAVAPLDGAVMAPGVVTVESHRKTIRHEAGGVVRAIFVDQGSQVTAGDRLLELDPTEAGARLKALRQKQDAAMARRARLVAERDDLETPLFRDSLLARAQSDPELRKLLSATARRLTERRAALRQRIVIERERISQLQQKIEGLTAARTGKARQVKILSEELVGLHELLEKGYYPRTRVLERERELARLEGGIGTDTAGIAEAQGKAVEIKEKIELIKQERRQEVAEELRTVEDQIRELDQSIAIAKRRLESTTLTAPVSGRIHNLAVHTVGGVVRAGEDLLQIIPAKDRLLITARVPPHDVDRVKVGQSAKVRMTGYDSRTSPELRGKVIELSGDRIVDEKRGEMYFEVRIDITKSKFPTELVPNLRPGMPSEVLISTGERTVISYLAKPLTDALSRSLIEH